MSDSIIQDTINHLGWVRASNSEKVLKVLLNVGIDLKKCTMDQEGNLIIPTTEIQKEDDVILLEGTDFTEEKITKVYGFRKEGVTFITRTTEEWRGLGNKTINVDLSEKEVSLINNIFEIASVKCWDSKIGDKKAQDIIDCWHNNAEHYGIFAMGINLLKKLGEKKL